jgi:hypothetical protein
MNTAILDIAVTLPEVIQRSQKCDREVNDIILRYVNKQACDKCKEILKKASIAYEGLLEDEILIHLNTIHHECIYYYDTESAIKGIEYIINKEEWSFNKSFSIIDFEGSVLTYIKETAEIFVNKTQVTNIFLHLNCIAFYRFVNVLNSDTVCDYYNEQKRELVFHSASKGVLKINIPILPTTIPYFQNLLPDVERLEGLIEIRDFPIHFKNQLFSDTLGVSEKRFINSILNLKSVLESSENDYQLYIKNFSFEKFKTDLQKEKEKYFLWLREIQNKLSGQIVSVPLAFSASIFATYKLEKDFYLLYFVGAAFFVYLIFTFFTLHYYYKDNSDLRSDIQRDKNLLIEASGIKADDIKIEFNKIENRSKRIKSFLILFIVSVTLLALIFFLYLYFQIGISKPTKPIDEFKYLWSFQTFQTPSQYNSYFPQLHTNTPVL